ncbi:complement C1q tumor necrosis factor-related protein 6 isoform 1 precursor [Anopheles sinensis]|uniref:Complement C1q tumor necrosis factor-related protein 6 isoform 1 n=1 Tax=Anopheles sinensis TaxID=74873 RepID=A0A084W0G5_ANOSI|nr:complement C1q tumor necrosis factor-related protein 6 isoform 1 precursor [Anopheles sinensis]
MKLSFFLAIVAAILLFVNVAAVHGDRGGKKTTVVGGTTRTEGTRGTKGTKGTKAPKVESVESVESAEDSM